MFSSAINESLSKDINPNEIAIFLADKLHSTSCIINRSDKNLAEALQSAGFRVEDSWMFFPPTKQQLLV